jgi:hypothetical protein
MEWMARHLAELLGGRFAALLAESERLAGRG